MKKDTSKQIEQAEDKTEMFKAYILATDFSNVETLKSSLSLNIKSSLLNACSDISVV